MSLTQAESKLLDRMETYLSSDEEGFINAAMQAVRDRAQLAYVGLANDDRAARFEAALIKYTIESRRR